MQPNEFIHNLLSWKCPQPGRGLPWAFSDNPYYVWISEIMLQQTRAQTVIPYFERFIHEFPDLDSLADASEDSVLSLWSGLGYYARARNLLSAAQQIKEKFGGIFPSSFEEIVSLPGIGRSTAGAICSLAYGQPMPILDGNAKRVYSRFYCVQRESESKYIRTLWTIAESHTTSDDSARYTQLIMDLGATVCLPKNPICDSCPLAGSCCAYQKHQIDLYPGSRVKKDRGLKQTAMLVIQDSRKRVLLKRRPPRGIWGGMWSFPEYDGDLGVLSAWLEKEISVRVQKISLSKKFNHDFTHFRLEITPVHVCVHVQDSNFGENCSLNFFELSDALDLGLPAPVRNLINLLDSSTEIQ